MNDRAPRLSIAVNNDLTRADRRARQVIENSVKAHPRRKAVDGSVSEIRWRKAIGSECSETYFGVDFRARVLCFRRKRRLLVDDIGFRHPVHYAGGRKKKPSHACLSCQLRKTKRRFEVNFPSPALIEVTNRVIAERSKVNDGIKTFEISESEIPDVFIYFRDIR